MFWIAESRGNLDMADQEEGDSLVCLQSSEAFPLKPMVKDDPRLEVPYHQLCGESVTFLGRASDAIIVLSSYRLLIRHKESFVNVPVMLIESVECRDLFYLVILCKDGKTYRCKFATNEQCQDWLTRLMSAIAPPSKLEDLFAFAFHAWCFDQIHHDVDSPGPGVGFLQSAGDIPTYSFSSEVRRQGFDTKEAWRIFENKEYKNCSSYPVQHIVPAWVTDEDLKEVCSFRASKRFPSVVWRHQRNGAVIARCSQPEIGWFGWRCEQDERFMESILRACNIDNPQTAAQETEKTVNGTAGGEASDVSLLPHLGSNPNNKKVLIVDARSYTAAYANRAKGGGCEFPEYYPSCDIQFMGLANIHSIRKSFQGVRNLCSNTPDGTNWLSLLEATKWLQHLSLLLKSALMVVNTVDKEACPVVVHCSDGWDRTPQIVALAELMLDSYYRTLEGFQVLVEREWLNFGHKFGDRCGHKPNDDDVNQRCPVFLQWLDCVHQLLKQYPTAFEFNETFLVKLVQHTYSCLFGTFLCNSAQQRAKHSIKDRTCSVWALLGVEAHKYRNFLFAPTTEPVLFPCCHVRTMHFWTAVFLSDSTPATCDDNSSFLQTAQTATGEGAKLTRTRSVDDLHKSEEENHRGSIVEGGPLVRRLSDPNLSELKLDGGRIGTPPQTRKLADRPIGGAVLRGEGDEMESTHDPEGSNNSAEEAADPDNQDVNQIEDSAASSETDLNSEPLTNGHSNGLLNGDCTDSDPDDTILDENSRTSTPKRCHSSSQQTVDKPMNGSTDTLTEELMSSRDGNPELNHWNECNGHTDTSDVEDEHQVFELKAECEITAANSLPSDNKQLGKSISISTSTSDLTSSTISGHPPDTTRTLFISESASLPELGIQTNLPNGDSHHVRHISSSSIQNFVSAPSSPVSSESQPCLTPDLEMLTAKASTSGLKVGRHFDEDGLTTIPAPGQDRLLGIMHRHQNEVAVLRHEVIRLQKLLQQSSHMKALFPHVALNGVVASELEDEKDRDASSRCGSITSDISWEQVDETETKRTLWIPDHAVTHCFKCNTQFNVVYRKHHCRSCGQVFCSTCTGFTAPIPHEQLYQPERVCKACYDMLDRNNSRKTQMAPGLG
ncbi:myotubularin-related protein 3-like isoform X2 [Patiria miniata]|uniref:phosphatidylinositol-3,5-bisphosphate 3-phosphatase n=1 Tax=Patiria miniata TaxID=46514 RepID=A0A914ADS7_PATMI|nr:myotubularin-related protein 3-like isoform X2 [Patiria miniata]